METRTFRPKRSVRHAELQKRQPDRPVPRHQAARLRRERWLQRLAIVAVVAVISLAIVIPAYGYWREVLRLGDAPLVVVDGQTISVEDYARYLGTRQAILTRQIGLLSASPTPVASPTASPGAPSAPPVLSSLQSQSAGLSTTALSELVEAHLLLDEAKVRQLTVTQAELDEARRWILSRPGPEAVEALGLVPAPSALSADALSADQARQVMSQIVGSGRFLSAAQIDELILKPAILKAKLRAELAKGVPSAVEQVHARHILVATEAEARSIRQQLENGADFAELAKKYSTDGGTKNKGGDLGWFGRGVMVPEFEQAAFNLNINEISQPVKTSFGYHIIQVLEKDPNRPLDAEQLKQGQDRAYQEWLGKLQSDPSRVSYQVTSAKLSWVRSYVAKSSSTASR